MRPHRQVSNSAPDAIVIGSGPNGLVAANVLADAGWSVVVLEAEDEPGGGVRSANYLGPGTVADRCSAFYPFAAASPPIADLELERYGLAWTHAPSVLAHPLLDGRCATLHRDLEDTTANLESLGVGDGRAWQQLVELWDDVGDALIAAIFAPFPPVVALGKLAARLRAAGLVHFARTALLPVRRLMEEEFCGPGSLLLAGSALHADLSPEMTGSGLFGWLLCMLGQQYGFPVPIGGAGEITAALVRRLAARGGAVHCGQPVTEIEISGGRARGVRTAGGETFPAGRAVLADVVAPVLYGHLVDWGHLPARMKTDIAHFQWDYSTVKVDWLVNRGIPWIAEDARSAGTVHVAADLAEMTQSSADIAMGTIPAHPFLLVGQMTTSDATRSPAGTESVWAYTHVPRKVRRDSEGSLLGLWDDTECDAMAGRIEQQIERFAPGFSSRVITRQVQGPRQLQAANRSHVHGAINGGTMQPHQQLLLRPVPGLGRPQTPITGLYLASASAHPGGGVHGACGSNAARAALRDSQLTRRIWSAGAKLTKRSSPTDASDRPSSRRHAT